MESYETAIRFETRVEAKILPGSRTSRRLEEDYRDFRSMLYQSPRDILRRNDFQDSTHGHYIWFRTSHVTTYQVPKMKHLDLINITNNEDL